MHTRGVSAIWRSASGGLAARLARSVFVADFIGGVFVGELFFLGRAGEVVEDFIAGQDCCSSLRIPACRQCLPKHPETALIC
jgi:hypothetical protein